MLTLWQIWDILIQEMLKQNFNSKSRFKFSFSWMMIMMKMMLRSSFVGHKEDEGFAFALVHSPFIVSLFASECYYSSIHVIGNCTYWQKRLFSASKIQWLCQQNQHFLLFWDIYMKKFEGESSSGKKQKVFENYLSLSLCVCVLVFVFFSVKSDLFITLINCQKGLLVS